MVATKELFQEAMPMIDCFDYSWSIVSDPQKAEQIENSLSAIISSDPDLALDTIGIHKDYEEMENRVVFGGFQALMPALGWLLGSQFQSYITAIDHWIAFILLVLIGGKMILDVVKEKGENEEVCPEGSVRIDLREFFLLAIATSIDALAIGIGHENR